MLLVGPPGSGKTHLVLDRLERAVRQGRAAKVKLVVPTVSMAQHTLHTLARRGLAAPGNLVVTLADFVSRLTPQMKEPTAAIESRLLDQAVKKARRKEFSPFEKAPGLRSTIAQTMREFWAAGCDSHTVPYRKTRFQQAFAAVFRAYEELLADAGYVHPRIRFEHAAAVTREGALEGCEEFYFDGFVNFTAGERLLIEAVRTAVQQLVVTLPTEPDPPLGQMAVERLKRIHRPSVSPVVVAARTSFAEVEEIARRIVEGGRPFHNYGVVLRSPEIYAPIIHSVFERFGIPFRLRLPEPLADHGAVRFLAGLLRCTADHFPAEQTLDVLKQPACVLSRNRAMDAFEFFVREKLPGDGLPFLREHARKFPSIERRLERLEAIAGWADEECTAPEWAERCRPLLRDWLQLPPVEDGIAMEQVLELRSLARAISGFEEATAQAVDLVKLDGGGRIRLADYWEALESVLRTTLVRTPDQRRNVVHGLSIFEARQWELPEVFVPGLVEGQFPRHHGQNLFFTDSDRLELRSQEIQLRLAADREAEENFLFQIATTRATERLTLSYPRVDEQGKPLLRSFLLSRPKEDDSAAEPIRLRESAPDFADAKAGYLNSPALKQFVSENRKPFSPTALEVFLQCPFKYFAEHTLKLREAPVRPEERLDARVEGNIVHRTIARWSEDRSVPIGDILKEVFEVECRANGVSPGFKALASRYRMQEDLSRFAREEFSDRIPGATQQDFEAEFEYMVDDIGDAPFRISGRIDRYDVFGEQLGFVVDYKYSGKQNIEKINKGHREGRLVQAPLYLLGLERVLGIRPAGMRFWGLRNETTLAGWVATDLAPDELVQKRDQRIGEIDLRGILQRGLEQAARAIDQIRDGRIEADPWDRSVCNSYCPFKDLCRIQL